MPGIRTIHTCIYLLHESECDMVKYFMRRLIYFTSQRRVKIKAESEISCHIAPVNVISGLFYSGCLRYSNLYWDFG